MRWATVFVVLLAAVPARLRAQDSISIVPRCEDETTAGLRRCFSAARERAGVEMERVLSLVRERANHSAALDSAQAKWMEFRQAECAAESEQFEGGSLQPVVFLRCWLELTERRLRYLDQLFRDP